MLRLDQVEAFKDQLGALHELQVARLLQLWSQLIVRSDEYVRAALLAEFPQLVDMFAAAASELTVEWYDSLGPSAYRARPAPLPDPEQLAASTRWAMSATAISPVIRLGATAERALFNASRETVVMNTELEGSRWARYASANACEFCRMLATREPVYASERAATMVGGRGRDVSANFTSDGRRRRGGQARGVRARGSQPLGSRYHDNCRCMAVPVRAGDTYEPPSYVEEWAAEYSQARAAADGVDAKSILAAWRQL